MPQPAHSRASGPHSGGAASEYPHRALTVAWADGTMPLVLRVHPDFTMPCAYHNSIGPIVDVAGRSWLFSLRHVLYMNLDMQAPGERTP